MKLNVILPEKDIIAMSSFEASDVVYHYIYFKNYNYNLKIN
jgi:hypothetical protein